MPGDFLALMSLTEAMPGLPKRSPNLGLSEALSSARIHHHRGINIFIFLKPLKQPVSSYDQQPLGSSLIRKVVP